MYLLSLAVPVVLARTVFTRASVLRAVNALRRSGGNTVVISNAKEPGPDVSAILIGLGFGLVTKDGIVKVTKPVQATIRTVRGETLVRWVDLRNLHPRALRDGRGTLVARTRLLAH